MACEATRQKSKRQGRVGLAAPAKTSGIGSTSTMVVVLRRGSAPTELRRSFRSDKLATEQSSQQTAAAIVGVRSITGVHLSRAGSAVVGGNRLTIAELCIALHRL